MSKKIKQKMSNSTPVEDAEIVEESKTPTVVDPTVSTVFQPTIDNPLPSEDIPPVPETIEETLEQEKDITTIRSEETGDKVYAVKAGKRYWVKNPESLKKIGFVLGQEKKVPFSELIQYPEGEPLDMTVPDAIYPWDKPEVPISTEPTTPYQIWN